MPQNNHNREMGHASKALGYLIDNDDVIASYPPEKLRAALLTDCKKNLEIFGPRFLKILRENPVLSLTEPELLELQEYVLALPKWKVV